MKIQNSSLKWVAGPRTPEKTYITRVFNFGTWQEWTRLKRRFSRRSLKKAVTDPLRGQWTPRAKKFAEILFDVKMPKDALISYDA